jgi:hypothetical protein
MQVIKPLDLVPLDMRESPAGVCFGTRGGTACAKILITRDGAGRPSRLRHPSSIAGKWRCGAARDTRAPPPKKDSCASASAS